MIKLIDILREAESKPKAILMTGPAGSGKSFVSKMLPLSKFKVINVDDEYEKLLQALGIGLKVSDFDSEKLSQAAKMMAQAQAKTKEKYAQLTRNLNNVLIDGTGAASRPLLKKKKELEDLGYETMMVMIYVSPITSLERNEMRDRTLKPGIVVQTWEKVNSNIPLYKSEFGDNFVLVNNDPKDADTEYDPEEVKKRFFSKSKAENVPQTPEQIAKREKEIEETNKSIQRLLKQKPEFTPIQDAVNKVKAFVS